MTESTRQGEADRKDDEAAQKRVKDAHHKGGGKAGTGDAMGGPNNDRQDTERAAEGEAKK
jgi:hypothetical protein